MPFPQHMSGTTMSLRNNYYGRALWTWDIKKASCGRLQCPYCGYRSFRLMPLKYHFMESHIDLDFSGSLKHQSEIPDPVEMPLEEPTTPSPAESSYEDFKVQCKMDQSLKDELELRARLKKHPHSDLREHLNNLRAELDDDSQPSQRNLQAPQLKVIETEMSSLSTTKVDPSATKSSEEKKPDNEEEDIIDVSSDDDDAFAQAVSAIDENIQSSQAPAPIKIQRVTLE